jgi:hypothetical protein
MTDVYTILRRVSTGTMLRVERVARGRAEGALREVLADAITLGNGEVQERITLLEIVSVWRRSSYALHGALIGALLGLGLGGSVAMKAFALIGAFLAIKALVIGVLIFGAVGALFGGALGAWLPRWKRVWP